MSVRENLLKLRVSLGLSQSAFAESLGVTQQTVQKWESGASEPTVARLAEIAGRYATSLDALVLDRDARTLEAQQYNKPILPNYEKVHNWELYSEQLPTELRQCEEEGLSLGAYREVFAAAAKLPRGEEKKRIADVLFDVVRSAPQREDYPYREPDTYPEILALCRPAPLSAKLPAQEVLADKIHGAWQGRVCGCMLGKTVEGVRTEELIPFLKMTNNYPMHRYILRSDFTDEQVRGFRFPFAARCYVDKENKMPFDDDTNYTILYQEIVAKYGRDFTPRNVMNAWLDRQPKYAYCTAERVAFCNAVKGYDPPDTARYQNPFREWIGAQIRADYFGYINPGNPEAAAEMAYRDASISHVKNGIYGEMFAAAAIAAAAVTDDITAILRAGIGQIPATSRLYEKLDGMIRDKEAGVTREACFTAIRRAFDEHNGHDWCHTISNAMIVCACLLYGEGDYGKSITMAVEAGFDTDCNAATVGSILGMRNGTAGIGEEWKNPIHDTLETTVFGVGTVRISDRAALTMRHLPK